MCYLEADEVAEILKHPDRTKPEGQRDHVLLAFLYNTGARIQEALNVRPLDIRLDSPAQVRLFGKGRVCFIKHTLPNVFYGYMCSCTRTARKEREFRGESP
jgi:site-specific recombinase XerD